MLHWTIVAHFRLDRIASEEKSSGQGALQTALEDVTFDVQVDEVARVLLLQPTRVVHEELDTEEEDWSGGQGSITTVSVVTRPLLLEQLVRVHPSLQERGIIQVAIGIRWDTHRDIAPELVRKLQAKVVLLRQFQVLEGGVQEVRSLGAFLWELMG